MILNLYFSGSAKMGTPYDPQAVVNHELKVKYFKIQVV